MHTFIPRKMFKFRIWKIKRVWKKWKGIEINIHGDSISTSNNHSRLFCPRRNQKSIHQNPYSIKINAITSTFNQLYKWEHYFLLENQNFKQCFQEQHKYHNGSGLLTNEKLKGMTEKQFTNNTTLLLTIISTETCTFYKYIYNGTLRATHTAFP